MCSALRFCFSVYVDLSPRGMMLPSSRTLVPGYKHPVGKVSTLSWCKYNADPGFVLIVGIDCLSSVPQASLLLPSRSYPMTNVLPLFAAIGLVFAVVPSSPEVPPLPATPRKPVTEVFHRMEVHDDYAWLQQANDPE